MEYKDLFNYCPKCKSSIKSVDNRLFMCTSCSFNFYANPAPCNAAIVYDSENRILLVKRKFDPMKGYWDLPGGFIEFGETVEESLRRELREELGIEIGQIKYISSFPDRYLYGNLNYHTLGMVYTARYEGQKLMSADDVAETCFFKPEDIPYTMIAFPSVTKGIRLHLSSSLHQSVST